MKTKISITLSPINPKSVDIDADRAHGRSDSIEDVVRPPIAGTERDELNALDTALIDANAERLNGEALDVLSYQDDIDP